MTFYLVYLNNTAHEEAHAQVFQRRGIKYKTKVSLFGSSWCEGEKDTKETNKAHDMIDAVGYHATVILQALVIMFVWIVAVS